MNAKKTAPEAGAEEGLPVLQECSKKAYEAWKAELGLKGKKPTDAVEHYRSIGMMAYADTLAEVIGKMEGHT